MDSCITNDHTFDWLRETLKWMIAEANQLIRESGGDWEPFLFVENERTVVPRKLAGFGGDTKEDQDYLTQVVIPEMVREARGHRAGVTFLATFAARPVDERSRRRRRSRPARDEAITLLVVDREHCELWVAAVDRDPACRSGLGPWVQLAVAPDGCLAEPLRRGLCPQG
jgi:hypothetical protein